MHQGATFTLHCHVVSPSLSSDPAYILAAHHDGLQVREDAGAQQLLCSYQADAHQQQVRPSLLSRLSHLRCLTYLPAGRPGEQSTLTQLVAACLSTSGGGLAELHLDMSEVVTASSRTAQQYRLPTEALQALIAMHPRYAPPASPARGHVFL